MCHQTVMSASLPTTKRVQFFGFGKSTWAKMFCLFILLFCSLCDLFGQRKRQHVVRAFFTGFKGTVYKTDSDLVVIGVTDGAEYTISAGLLYRKLDEENDSLYLKVLRKVKTTGTIVAFKAEKDSLETETSDVLYRVKNSDLKNSNRIWQQGLSISTLMLPVKYRPATELNGTYYKRAFSTDISIGPFVSYKFRAGHNYKQFLQFGAFAGPTLIQFPSTVDSDDGQPNQSNISSDNHIGFTAGSGVVFQRDKFQIGLVYGCDWLGGERSKEWQYDGKGWWSFAIGFKFLDEK